MSWLEEQREQRRADRAAEAALKREDDAAAVQRQISLRQAEAKLKREDARERARQAERDRQVRSDRRKARWPAVRGWLTANVIHVLFVPIVVVPAVLAWTAMAAYGHQVYGLPGWLLPAFSEFAMWAFALATTLTRRGPGAPVWHLQAGTVAFAAVAAVLNFIHGTTPAPPGEGLQRGISVGVVMALVSIAGVLAHQLITAGPRRTTAQRREARLGRLAARREARVRRAAIRQAVAELDADGQARLVHQPGRVRLDSRAWRRPRLVPEPAEPAQAGPGDPVGEELAAEISTWLAEHGHPDSPADHGGSREPSREVAVLEARVRAAIDRGVLPERPSRRQLQRFLRVRTRLAGQVRKALIHNRDTGDGGDGDDGAAGVPVA